MAKIHRTTFTRQAANLCQVKKRIWQRLQVQLPEGLHIADSVPIPVCKFARANRHKLFRGWADYGHDATEKHTFYGFRLHILATLPGIVVGFALAPANIHETQVIESIVDRQRGLLLGDSNYWSPRLRQAFEKQGLRLHTPFKKKSSERDTEVGWSVLYGQVRYRIKTIFSQLEG